MTNLAVAAVAAAVTYGVSAPASPPPAPTVSSSLHLVDYRGEQPKGFTIDKVPDGWEVQGVNAGVLTLGPIGLKDKNPDSFVDKIAVMLQSQDDHSTSKAPMSRWRACPASSTSPPTTPTTTKNLWVKQRNNVWLQVQIWDGTTWTTDSIVEFGAGIHVLKDAVQGHG